VKWKGYDKPEDYTWEPEDNLLYALFHLRKTFFNIIIIRDSSCYLCYREGAEELLKEYYDLIGGRPEKQSKKRKAQSETKATPDKIELKKPRRPNAADQDSEEDDLEKPPRSSNWERDVVKVETIQRDAHRGLIAFLHWEDGKTYKVSIQQCYEKCPMKVGCLHYFSEELPLTIIARCFDSTNNTCKLSTNQSPYILLTMK
jgi:chromobox protein 1